MKTLKFTTVLLALVLFTTSAFAGVATEIGGWSFMTEGQKATFGYSITGEFPTGIEKENIVRVIPKVGGIPGQTDTIMVKTYELLLKADLFYSDARFGDRSEFQAQVFSMINRKTLGIWKLYTDMGGTLWNIARVADSTGANGNDENLTGLYLGLGATGLLGFDFSVGGHYISVSSRPDIAIVGFKIGRSF